MEKLLPGDGSENLLREVSRDVGVGLEAGFQPLLVFDDGFQLVSLLLEVMSVNVEKLGEVPKGAMEGQLSFDVGVGVHFLEEALEIFRWSSDLSEVLIELSFFGYGRKLRS